MRKATMASFPWWNLTNEALEPRSILYAPAPRGCGTIFGESLTSYLARLADAHCIYPGVLLQQMIVPLIQDAKTQGNEQDGHPLFRRDGNGSHLINVTGPRACSAVHALETLTLRTNLRCLTLKAASELLPPRKLTRQTL